MAGVTRVRSGDATVTISGADGAWVRGAVGRAMGGALRTMEAAAENLADKARAEWYGPNGVDRETGKSGDVVTVTTVDLAKSEVRVSIGSTDDRTAGGKPMPVYVHRAWGSGLESKAVSREAWFAWRAKRLPVLPPPPSAFTRRDGKARSAASLQAEQGAKEFWGNPDKTKGLTLGKWYVLVGRTDAGEKGKGGSRGFLLVELVRKPAREMVKQLAPEVVREIAARVNGG